MLEARDWVQRRPADLPPLERAFIDSSIAAAAKRRRRRRFGASIAALVVVLAVVAGVAAVLNGNTASARQRIALSENYAALSDNAVGTNLASADLYALAAWRAYPTVQARSSLLSREADPFAGSYAEPAQFIVASLAISPDGRLLAVAGTPDPRNDRISSGQLWDLATRRLLVGFTTAGPVRTVAFSPDGSTLVATPATGSGNLLAWSVTTHRELPDPVSETGVITSIAYSPDGSLLAVGELIPAHPSPGVRPSPPACLP